MQQLSWIYELCNADGVYLKHDCCTCFAKINFYIDNITQCKQCFKLLHKSCDTSNVCLDCLPISIIHDDILQNTEVNRNNDFFKNLPYFSPFEFYCREITNFLPDAEELNDNLQECSRILYSCDYFDVEKLCKELNSEAISLIALNIDGFRSNFSSFLIMYEKNRSRPIDGYLICETNVTDFGKKVKQLQPPKSRLRTV